MTYICLHNCHSAPLFDNSTPDEYHKLRASLNNITQTILSTLISLKANVKHHIRDKTDPLEETHTFWGVGHVVPVFDGCEVALLHPHELYCTPGQVWAPPPQPQFHWVLIYDIEEDVPLLAHSQRPKVQPRITTERRYVLWKAKSWR